MSHAISYLNRSVKVVRKLSCRIAINYKIHYFKRQNLNGIPFRIEIDFLKDWIKLDDKLYKVLKIDITNLRKNYEGLIYCIILHPRDLIGAMRKD